MENPIVPFSAGLPEHLRNKEATVSGGMITDPDILPRISLRGSRFTFIVDKDNKQQANTLTLPVIILGVTPKTGRRRNFYIKGFDPNDDISPPDCSSENGIVPDTHITSPISKSCAVCPNNVFGSDRDVRTNEPRGGKACKESKKLLVTGMENISEGTIFEMTVPVMSLKGLSTYGRILQKQGLDPFDVVTNISFVEGSDYPQIKFDLAGFISQSVHHLAVERANSDDVQDHIVDPADFVVPAGGEQAASPASTPTPTPATPIPADIAPAGTGGTADAAPMGFGFTTTPIETPAPAQTTSPTPAPQTTSIPAIQPGVDVPDRKIFWSRDGRHIMWNPNVHATATTGDTKGGPSFKNDGSFQKKRGVDDTQLNAWESSCIEQYGLSAAGAAKPPAEIPAATTGPTVAGNTVTTPEQNQAEAPAAGADNPDLASIMGTWAPQGQ